MSTRSIAPAFLALLALAACRTTTTSTPPGLAQAVVLRSHAAQAWDVVDGQEVRGSVVRFAEPGAHGRAWFSVRNAWAQEVGIVDVEGRAWRHRPHQPEPEWLGTGTVAAGAARILAAPESSRLVEVEVGRVAERAQGRT